MLVWTFNTSTYMDMIQPAAFMMIVYWAHLFQICVKPMHASLRWSWIEWKCNDFSTEFYADIFCGVLATFPMHPRHFHAVLWKNTAWVIFQVSIFFRGHAIHYHHDMESHVFPWKIYHLPLASEGIARHFHGRNVIFIFGWKGFTFYSVFLNRIKKTTYILLCILVICFVGIL